MKKSMIKIIAIILASFLCLLFFAACNQTKESKEPTQPVTEDSGAGAPASEQSKTEPPANPPTEPPTERKTEEIAKFTMKDNPNFFRKAYQCEDVIYEDDVAKMVSAGTDP